MRDLNALDPLPKLGMKLEAPKPMTEAEKKAKAMRDFETATDKPVHQYVYWVDGYFVLARKQFITNTIFIA